MLDGDRLRAGLCAGLGFNDPDREEHLRRAAETARIGLESGLIVIAAFVTPRELHREMIRTMLGRDRVSFVYSSASIEECQRRDVKGLYAKARGGLVSYVS